ncbi:MAG: TonB-dependent receptor [Myxococcota bacterium]|nr:TonB-dependent receptor [Myxococcota bacterium]
MNGRALRLGLALCLWCVRAAAEPISSVDVRGERPGERRGVFDLELDRELLHLSPRFQTSELLSAAPGFFVDHEDGEGLGNDVYLRGFDLSHGSGIEMRVGLVPINSPVHVRGQGYADVNFVIPEVVSSVRVSEGSYDPRQGDAAIVGSARFELGVAERGALAKFSYGSFNQQRVVGLVAPEGLDEKSFAAVALRRTDGFGERREARSGTVNAQSVLELGSAGSLTLLGMAYAARASLPGVVREDDVDAGRIGFYGSYPYYAQNQSLRTGRVLVSAELRHQGPRGSELVLAPFFQWSDLRARENYAGVLEVSELDPSVFAQGDLFETRNLENALGLTAYYASEPLRVGEQSALRVEPGLYLRAGDGEQTKSLLRPEDASPWDRRLDADVSTLDAGAYLDLIWILSPKWILSGGARADLLLAGVSDHLAGLRPSSRATAEPERNVGGVAVSPRATLAYEPSEGFTLQGSYGEGFRSLPVPYLRDGMSQPYSKVRSAELGITTEAAEGRFESRLALFNTWVENEMVFVAEEGGLDTQHRSVRRGLVGSFVLRPRKWLLASTALSVTDAVYRTRVAGISHRVPNVPPLLLRADLAVRGQAMRASSVLFGWRFGLGYTFLSGQHLSDLVVGPATHALNASFALRPGPFELGLDVYDLLGRKNADRADYYVSNWSLEPGQQRASLASHLTAAPPRTVIASATAYF